MSLLSADLAALTLSRRRALRVLAVALTLGLVVHVASTSLGLGLERGSSPVDALQIALIAGGGLLCLLRAAWTTGTRIAWAAIGLGLCSFAAGDVVYLTLFGAADEVPIPSGADLLWLGFYLGAATGFVALVRRSTPRFVASMWLDGLVGALGGGAVLLAVVLQPVLDASGSGAATVVTNLSYPVADLGLLSLVVAVVTLSGGRPARQWIALGFGLGLFVVADTLYLLQTASGTYADGRALDSLWALAALAIGGSAWLPESDREFQPDGWGIVVVPTAFGAIAIGVLVYGSVAELPTAAAVLAAGALVCAGARALMTFHGTQQLAQARRDAVTDELTGLPNRRGLQAILRDQRRAPSAPRALLLLALEEHEEVRNTLGGAAGDLLLCGVAERLADGLPENGVLTRHGDDEFAVMLPVADRAAALQAAGRLHALLLDPVMVDGIALDGSVRVGVALLSDHGIDPERLLRRADVALREGRARAQACSVYDPDRDVHAKRHLALAGELRDAIARDELEVHYQPVADLHTGAVVGTEALVRWRHPDRGLLMPDHFLPVAEQSGLMRPLGRAVLAEAVARTARWHQMGLALHVAVNLAPQDLVDLELPAYVRWVLERHDLAPGWLRVELTEQTLVTDPEKTAAVLAGLGELGVVRSLDDFGTGFSSMTYLQRLHVDEIKVDRSFVAAMGRDPASTTIVRSVVELGRSLGLRTVAEGVESAAHRDQLAALGCDEYQGYLLSRPLPAAAAERWLLASAAGATRRRSRVAHAAAGEETEGPLAAEE